MKQCLFYSPVVWGGGEIRHFRGTFSAIQRTMQKNLLGFQGEYKTWGNIPPPLQMPRINTGNESTYMIFKGTFTLLYYLHGYVCVLQLNSLKQ